jgi:ammonia channel protein AmtB
MASIMVGKGMGRMNKKKRYHDLLISMVGISFMWTGWFGFNAGSAVSAGNRAGFAILTTQISSGTGALSWILTEWFVDGRPTILGMMNGAISGLVAVTPATGFVDTTAAFVIGLLAGPFCFYGTKIKEVFRFDDSLDAFGIHAIGGALGSILTGLFAKAEICGVNGALYGNPKQLYIQLYGILFTFGWSAVVSALILKALDLTIGLRCKVVYNQMGTQSNGSNKQLQVGPHRVHPSHNGQQFSMHIPTLPVEFQWRRSTDLSLETVGSARSSSSVSGKYFSVFKPKDSTHQMPQKQAMTVRKIGAVSSVKVEPKPH